MGAIHSPKPVLRLVAVLSRHDDALAWGRNKIEQAWGPLALVSEPFEFNDTEYYAKEMGTDLKKQFIASALLSDPGELADLKHQTNAWETEYADLPAHAEPRPLNLDPGSVSESKLVLASTKNHSHRVYLSRGIYAEVTLGFARSTGWVPQQWTYPDYQRKDFQSFFTECRNYLRQSID
ncbi:MAG: DUF4416 family protein [Aeoliella sp.]